MDLETRRKISRTMKGKSNFEGHHHTHASKIKIKTSQEGHRNAAGHKWVTDLDDGDEHRVLGDKPRRTRWGRKRSSMPNIVERIIKFANDYRLVSKKTGKNLGTFETKAAAEKHEKEVAMFKHMKNESVADIIIRVCTSKHK